MCKWLHRYNFTWFVHLHDVQLFGIKAEYFYNSIVQFWETNFIVSPIQIVSLWYYRLSLNYMPQPPVHFIISTNNYHRCVVLLIIYSYFIFSQFSHQHCSFVRYNINKIILISPYMTSFDKTSCILRAGCECQNKGAENDQNDQKWYCWKYPSWRI